MDQFHNGTTLMTPQHHTKKARTVFWGEERHFHAMLVHLSPEGGQVVWALFLAFVLSCLLHLVPPTTASWKSTAAFIGLGEKTHTSCCTLAVSKTVAPLILPQEKRGDENCLFLCHAKPVLVVPRYSMLRHRQTSQFCCCETTEDTSETEKERTVVRPWHEHFSLSFCLLCLSFQQSLTLVLSLSSTSKVLDPLAARGYSLPHVFVCVWGCVCRKGEGWGVGQEMIVFPIANRLRLVKPIGSIKKPLRGVGRKWAIRHLSFTVHSLKGRLLRISEKTTIKSYKLFKFCSVLLVNRT